MASILDKYGIKEVADVMWYNIGDDGEPTNPVLYLDTLKVSTTEQTAEEAEARGGKGNPPLIIWDYGKEINVTLEDALFSAKSMAILFGGSYSDDMHSDSKKIRKTFTYTATGEGYFPISWPSNLGTQYITGTAIIYSDNGETIGSVSYTGEGKDTKGTFTPAGEGKKIEDKKTYFISFYIKASNITEIEISPNTFPGNYYITGDTYARAQKNGKDEFFQFIIPNAKVQSEQTLTLEAEGDPTVFNLNLRVLRPVNGGAMMKLVKYNIDETGDPTSTEPQYSIIVEDQKDGKDYDPMAPVVED